MTAATLPTVTTAAEALDRYNEALAHDQLVQRDWHGTAADGRWLACALGVIGEEVAKPADCPASVMPTWLAQTVPYFFDGLELAKAKDWGLAFYSALARLNGDVPFRVYHRWMAECVLPIAAASARATPGAEDAVAANDTMIALHARARDGDMPGEKERSAAKSAAKSAAESAAWSAAESAAESAAWSAARSAAWSAVWSAARSAAESAAWSAAESAAWSAAESAAWSAAESAARSAAWSAAIESLAYGLVDAMHAEAA